MPVFPPAPPTQTNNVTVFPRTSYSGGYSGPAFAANALSQAISEIFGGLVAGQKSSSDLAQQLQQIRSGMAAEQRAEDVHPYDIQRRQLEATEAQQRMEHQRQMFPQQLEQITADVAGMKARQPLELRRLQAGTALQEEEVGLAPHRTQMRTMDLNRAQQVYDAAKTAHETALEELETIRATKPGEIAKADLAVQSVRLGLRQAEANLRLAEKNEKDLYAATQAMLGAYDPNTDKLDTQKATDVLIRYGHVLHNHPLTTIIGAQLRGEVGGSQILAALRQVESMANREADRFVALTFGQDAIRAGGTSVAEIRQWRQQYDRSQLFRQQFPDKTPPPVPPLPAALREHLTKTHGVDYWFWNNAKEKKHNEQLVDRIDMKLRAGMDYNQAVAEAIVEAATAATPREAPAPVGPSGPASRVGPPGAVEGQLPPGPYSVGGPPRVLDFKVKKVK